jgi:signal transduction histidine kinase/ActR/RegA family two-component response regulator
MYFKIVLKRIFIIGLLFFNIGLVHSQSYNILLINSYHEGLSWSDDVIEGFEKQLSKEITKDYDLFIEYLDAKRYSSFDHDEVYFEYLKAKYANQAIDLIVANDDKAYNFLVDFKDKLFGNCPVVFTGLNAYHDYPKGYTGLNEKIDFKANLDLIQELHSDINRLFIVMDNTETGKLLKEEIRKEISLGNYSFQYNFLSDYTFEEIFRKTRQLRKGDVLFLGIFTEDRNRTYHSFTRTIDQLKQNTSVPIYSAWDFYLNKGIIGGKLIQGVKFGEYAAKVALEVLNGKDPNSIPVQLMQSDYVFDYNEIKQHDIALKKLPDNAIIINSPYNLFKENKGLFIALATVILLLLVIIIVLLRYNRIKKKRLKEQEEYLHKIEKINKDIEYAKERAQESNRLKTSFLANISHEIRTPLNAIIGFSRLITDQRSLDPASYYKYHNLLKINSDLLLNLINDIIDLSKIETNQLKLHFRDFDLNELMDSLYEYAIEEVKKKNRKRLKITVEKGIRKESFFIRSDNVRLRQVLMHLINNSVKFTNEGEIQLGYRVNGNFILFYLKDTGIGLSEHEHKYIFDSFRQGEEGTTKKYGGAGLGLTLSKGIVENLKGQIWCESDKGNGSVFYVQVPFKPAMEKRDKKSKDFSMQIKEQYNWQGKKILVVEDSHMAYELITKLLKGTGAEFTLEKDGLKAIERCKNDENLDLVLMDIQLPFLDGYEATRRIKEIRPELPIIAQTANAMLDDRRRALEAGCEEYIAKPLDRIELADKINKLLYEFKSS